MQLNQRTIDLVKSFEGFRDTAYLCPAKVWTIGYGSTKGVKRGDRITEAAAEQLLLKELEAFGAGVRAAVTVPLNDNEYGALTSFAFNVGLGAFRGSTLLRLLNAGNRAGAADQLLRWNRGGGRVLPGLTRRRQAERQLFLTKP